MQNIRKRSSQTRVEKLVPVHDEADEYADSRQVEPLEPKDDTEKSIVASSCCGRQCGCLGRACGYLERQLRTCWSKVRFGWPKYTALQVRKRYRILLLTAVVVFEIFFVAFCSSRVSHSRPVRVPLNEPLEFELQYCKLHVEVVDPSASWLRGDQLPVHGFSTVWYDLAVPLGRVAGEIHWKDEDVQGQKFTLCNQIEKVAVGLERTEACIVHVAMLRGSTLDSLKVTCKDHCIVTTDMPEAMTGSIAWTVTGAVTIDSLETSFPSPLRLRDVALGSLHITANKSDVFLEDVEVQGASSVSVVEGNVYSQLRSDVRVHWMQSTSFYCLAAPTQPRVSTSGQCAVTYLPAAESGNVSTLPNGTATVQTILAHGCDGWADICVNSTACGAGDAALSVPIMNITVPAGSFYVTRREFASESVQTHAGAGFNSTNADGRYQVAFDGASEVKFAEAAEVLADPSRLDTLYTIEGPPMVRQARASNGYLYTISPSVAHAQLGPWWLAFFSWGLLVKKVEVLKVDLRNAPCPYAPVLDVDAVGDIDQVIREKVVSATQELAYIVPSGAAVGTSSPFPFDHEVTDWGHFIRLSEDWYTLSATGDGHFVQSLVDIASNGVLLAALIISVIVSVLVSGMIQYVVWQLLSTGVLALGDYGSHIQRYEQVTFAVEKRGGPPPDDNFPGDDSLQRGTSSSLPNRMNSRNSVSSNKEIIPLKPAGTLSARSLVVPVAPGEPLSSPRGKQEKVRSVLCSCCPRRWPFVREYSPTTTSIVGVDTDHKAKKESQSAVKFVIGRQIELLSFSRMPPMFSVIDHAIFVIHQSYLGNSLDDFLNQAGVIRESSEIEDATATPPPTLTRFKNVYSKYCFLLEKEEKHLRAKECVDKIQKRGFKLEALGPLETPDAFISIRCKTDRELQREEEVGGGGSGGLHSMLPGETSLDFFLRDQCKITHFDQDRILVDDFKARYSQFCQKHRLTDAVTVSKALMLQKKISSAKIATFRIVPAVIPAPGDAKQAVKIMDIGQAEAHNKAIINERDNENEESFLNLWWVIDTLSVASHLLMVGLVAFFPVTLYCTLQVAYVYSFFSTKQPEYLFRMETVLTQPARVFSQILLQFPYIFMYLAITGAATTFVGYMELLIYYGEDEFFYRRDFLIATASSDSKASMSKRRLRGKRLRRWVHVYQWIQVTITILVASFLLGQVMVWCILGAMINPNAFLAYATAVLTFVTFATAKWAQMQTLFNQSFDQIVASMGNVVNDAINRTLKTLIEFGGAELGNHVEKMTNGLQDVLMDFNNATGGALQQQVLMLSGGGLGKNIMSAGFDISTLVGVATGKVDAVQAFAEQSNVPVEIVNLLSALADRDCDTIIKAIGELLAKHQPNALLAPELVVALAELAFEPTRPKVDKCIKALYKHALPAIIRMSMQEVGVPKELAKGADLLASHMENSNGLMADAQAAQALYQRLASHQGLTDDEKELVKAKATQTVQNTMELPELQEVVKNVEALDPDAVVKTVAALLQDQRLHKMLWDAAVETVLTLLKGAAEVKSKAGELSAATLASQAAEAIYQIAPNAKEILEKTAELACRELEKLLAAACSSISSLGGMVSGMGNFGGGSFSMPGMPNMPQMNMPNMPNMPNMSMPGMPSMPHFGGGGSYSMPNFGSMPSMPGMPGMPNMPNVRGVPAAAQDLVMGVLPPLMKGIMSLGKELDYQKFVDSLRYVHSTILQQKAHFASVFGARVMESFESLGPIFHVLDLALGTEQIQSAIANILEDKNVLCLPSEITKFVQLVIWLRVPTSRIQALKLSSVCADFMESFTARRKVLKDCLRFFKLDEELLVLMEIIMGMALNDLRALTHPSIGERLADCAMKISGNFDESRFPEAREVLGKIFQIGMTFLATFQLSDLGHIGGVLQTRTGLDSSLMKEIMELYVRPVTDRQRPPAGMTEWQLMRAAAAHVGLEVKEAVGLAHLLMGFADTPEVTMLLHEIMRRQDLVTREAFDLDRFIICLLAVSFAKSDQSVMLPLQELRVKDRFLSALGLGQLAPRYISEEMLRSVGIEDEGVLRARLEVPYKYEDDPAAWDEWLEKAQSCIRGNHQLGHWYHIKSMRQDLAAEPMRKGFRLASAALRDAQARREQQAMERKAADQAKRHEKLMRALPTVAVALRRMKEDANLPNRVPSRGASPRPTAQSTDTMQMLANELHEEAEDAAEDQRYFGMRAFVRASGGAVGGAVGEVGRMGIAGAVKGSAGVAGAVTGVVGGAAGAVGGAVGGAFGGIFFGRGDSEQAENWEERTATPTTPPAGTLGSTARRTSHSSGGRKFKVRQNTEAKEDDGGEQGFERLQSTGSFAPKLSSTRKINALQLSWLSSGVQKDQLVQDLVDHYNEEVDELNKDEVEEAEQVRQYFSSSKAQSSTSTLPKRGNAVVIGKLNPETDYTLQHAERELRELQDLNTGSLHKLNIQGTLKTVILKILMMDQIVKPTQSKDLTFAGKRRLVVQEYAELLGVQPADMAVFFNLVRPEHTHDCTRALAVMCRSTFPSSTMSAMSQVAYAVRRFIPVFGEVRSILWETMRQFYMPRFLGNSVLIPSTCYPPQLREIAGVVHFFMEPVLKIRKYNTVLQHSLYNIMGLICGAPRNAYSLLDTFGICETSVFSDRMQGSANVVDVLQMMLRPTASDKLVAIPKIIRAILRYADSPALTNVVIELYPYLIYFAGFPNSEISPHFDETQGRQSVLDIIAEDTGIIREVLLGIELSQHSISSMSQSDTSVFSRESVLGLLLPVMNAARRISRNMEALPTDGMVKALVSLAYCKIDHLEYLAEALGMDTFMVHLAVYLVDLSRNPDDSTAVEQILQQIRMSSGIKRAMDISGADHAKTCAVLELSCPCIENIPSLKKLLDRLGLGQIISGGIMQLLYTSVNCALLHLRGDSDPKRHEVYTDLLRTSLDSICQDLTFHESLVPLLGIRLFQGDFHVLQTGSSDLQRLLPFTLERHITMGVAGLLGHVPPTFTYNPVVLNGAARIRLMMPEASGPQQIIIYTDTPLPKDPIIVVRAMPPNNEAFFDPASFNFSQPRVGKKYFVLQVDFFPAEFQDRRIDIRWQAFPDMEAEKLRAEQHRVASSALKELEEVCWYKRIHWGGAACVWWDELDCHPLFILLANGDINAIRLAADLLWVPDIVLAFLLATISLANPDELKPLLYADLVLLPVIKKIINGSTDFKAEQVRPAPMEGSREEGIDPSPSDTMARKLGLGIVADKVADENMFGQTLMQTKSLSKTFSRPPTAGASPEKPSWPSRPLQDTVSRLHPPIEEDEGFEKESEDSGEWEVDLGQEEEPNRPEGREWTRTPEQHFLDNLDQSNFPDAVLQLYEQDIATSPFEDLSACMGQALWLQWHYRQTSMKTCTESTFERAAIDCMNQLKSDEFETSAADDKLLRWNTISDNMHVMFGVMLWQLFVLLEDESELRQEIGNAPSVGLIVCLTRLHQARRECSFCRGPTPVSKAECHLLPAMWGLEVHLRSRQKRLQRNFLDEVLKIQNKLNEPTPAWAIETLGGFSLPDKFDCMAEEPLEASMEDWEWEKWQWPQDEIVEMCCRCAQVSRLALGVAAPLECRHIADKDPAAETLRQSQRKNAEIIDDEKKRRPRRVERGWTSVLHDQSVLHYQKMEVMKDLVDEQALDLLMVFAASGADPLDAAYTFQQIHELPDGPPKAIFEDKTAIYDSMLSMLATSYDEVIAPKPMVRCPKGHGLKRVRADEELWKCQATGEARGGLLDPGELQEGQPDPHDCHPGCLSACATYRDHAGIVYYMCGQCAKDEVGYCLCEPCYNARYDATFPQDARTKLGAASTTLLRLLPSADNLGSRAAVWAPQICWHIGIMAPMIQVIVNVAHGFVEDHRGKLLRANRKAFEEAAGRFHCSGRGKTAALLLQSLLTKAWSRDSTGVLADHLDLNPEVVYNLINAALPGHGQVKGWIALSRILFGHINKQAIEDVKNAGKKGRKVKAATLAAAQERERQDKKAGRFAVACMLFNDLSHGSRGHLVYEQRERLDTILMQMLPALLGETQTAPGISTYDETVKQRMRKISALMLHLLSNHNTAAASVMQDNPFIHEALGLSRQQAEHMLYFSLLTGLTSREVEEDMVKDAVETLTKPLVDYVVRKSESGEAAEAKAVPTDAFCKVERGAEEEIESILEDRMHALLNCMFGMATQNNKRVLGSILNILKMDCSVSLRGEKLKEFMRKMKKPITMETKIQLRDNKDCRAVALLQTLHTVRRIREASAYRRKGGMANAKGAAGLTFMVRAAVNSAEDVATKLGSGLESGLKAMLGSVTKEDLKQVVEGAHDLADIAASRGLGAAGAAAFEAVRGAVSQPGVISAAPPPVSRFEGRCPKRHKLTLRATTVDDGSIPEWTCAGHSEPGGCWSGLTPFHHTGHLRSYACEECGYYICEKCHLGQFQIISGAKNPELNGLYVANKAMREQGGRFVYVKGAYNLLRGENRTWEIWRGPKPQADVKNSGPEGELVAYTTLKKFWKEKRGDGYGENPAMQRFREEPPMREQSVAETKVLNVTQHFLVACLCSDRSEIQVTEEFVSEFQVLLPVMVGIGGGRLDVVLTALQKIASNFGRSKYSDDMNLLLDVLSIVGMNREVFLGQINVNSAAREAGLLPNLVKRLFTDVAPELSVARDQLEALVNKLFNLMVGICVEAPVELLNKMISDIIDQSKPYSLVGFAMTLIKGEERVEKAAGQLINSMCWIAQASAEGKSLTQMKLFTRGPQGEKPRIDVILEAVMDLLLPFLGPDTRRPIYSILEVLTDLYELSTDPAPNNFVKRAPFIAQGVATALGLPEHQIKGIFGLAKGDWEDAVDLCKPFCDIDPQVLHEMMRFLPTIKNTCKSSANILQNLKEHVEEDYIKNRVKQITGNVVEHKGTALDLFDLVDLDRNGTISLEEFRMCTLRLGFNLGEHRVMEVFSKCKKNIGSASSEKGEELNPEEFKQALDYLQHKVATISLSMLGNSLGWLLCKLVYLCVTLLLCFIFIFLAMSAFLSGGVFSAIVNSAFTIGTGLSLALKDYKDKTNGDEQRKFGAVVEEIQDMVMNDQ